MDLPQGGPHSNPASPSVHWTGQFPSLLGAPCGPSVSTRQTQQCSALSLLYSLVTDRIRDLHELTNRFCLDHNIYLSGGCCLYVHMSHFTPGFSFKSRNARKTVGPRCYMLHRVIRVFKTFQGLLGFRDTTKAHRLGRKK